MRTDLETDVDVGVASPAPSSVAEDHQLANAVSAGTGAEESAVRRTRHGFDIQRKLLSLVVLSALVPACLVGVVSYVTARQILVDKIHSQLDARLAASEEHLESSLARRIEDAEVFASTLIVSRALGAARSIDATGLPDPTDSMREQLARYLEEVAERSPMYRQLAVVDAAGGLVARTGATGTVGGLEALLPRAAQATGVTLDTLDGESVVVVFQPIRSEAGADRGSLIMVGGLDEVWDRLLAEALPGRGRLLILDESGVPVLDSGRPESDGESEIGTEGVRRALAGDRGVAEYRDESGLAVVGSFRYCATHDLGLVIELPAVEAFAAVTRMRNAVLVISLLATMLIAGVGSLLALNLTRPIRALSQGAQLVAGGDLTTEVPVSSRDQIGDLTQTFNRMVGRLRSSQGKLETLSVTDELTGLYNRRYLTSVLDKEINRAQRAEGPMSVMMLDLDHFKAFNDLLGHLAGDDFLRQVAELMIDQFRSTDVVARYGGEEFVAVLPGTPKRRAAEIAERLRVGFETHPRFAELAPKVTLSAGLATYPEDGENPQDLLRNADIALYRAKDLGRNRVEMFSQPREGEGEG